MNKSNYAFIENYMNACMEDSAHDNQHIYRVLFNALRIAKKEKDADKLDVAGAMGIARTLIYKGIVKEPMYSLLSDGSVSNGENDTTPSFFSGV